MKEVVDSLVNRIATQLKVSKKRAREILTEALSSTQIVSEILEQARFLNDPDAFLAEDDEGE